MKFSSIGQSRVSDELFHENETKNNRLVSLALFIIALVDIFLGGLHCLGVYDLVHNICAYTFIITGTLGILVVLVAKLLKYDRPWIKSVLIMVFILNGGVAFFFYPLNQNFICYGPIIIAAMYFDVHLTNTTSNASLAIYTLALWLNVFLDGKSEAITAIHELQQVYIWANPQEILLYRQIPNTLFFAITKSLCIGITKRGVELITKHDKLSKETFKLKSEMEAAAKIQSDSLPAQNFIAPNNNIEINAFMHPAKETGGDFYDYFLIDNDLVFLVADVSDKGLAAAMFMMRAKNTLGLAIRYADSLVEAVKNTNEILCEENPEDMFVTLWLGKINIKTGVGKYVNCAHPNPIVRHKDGSISRIENEPDVMLGVFNDVEVSEHSISLSPEDTILVFSDGMTDVERSKNDFFGDERLCDAVKNKPEENDNLCSYLEKQIKEFVGDYDQADDTTALTLKINETRIPQQKNLVMDCSYDAIEKVIDETNEMLIKEECPENIRRNIDASIDEILSNIVDYAYEGSSGQFEIRIVCSSNFIDLTFVDSGMPFDVLNTADPNQDDEPQIGGYGLYIVKNLMDDLHYQRIAEQNIFTMTKIWHSKQF